ncbi:MAG: hypothetical protein FJ267_02520, partial [Planctomycetes bacterium]|nr:hypothetical protein [Planctomycetota bacterium]
MEKRLRKIFMEIEDPKENSPSTNQFLTMATVFQGGLLFAGLFFGWIARVDFKQQLQVTFPSLILGVGATLPMLLFFWVSYRSTQHRLVEIKKI